MNCDPSNREVAGRFVTMSEWSESTKQGASFVKEVEFVVKTTMISQ